MEYIEPNINQQPIRDLWKNNEWPDRHDGNANDRLEIFNNKTFNVDLVQIDLSDFDNIVLPAHHEQFIYCSSDLTLAELLNKFKIGKLPNFEAQDKCRTRIQYLYEHFDEWANKFEYLQGKFMFLTKNQQLSVQKSYKFEGYYTGSFHQFAAYSFWISTNEFKPLRLFLIN
ncbi:MAG: hypothetical protein RJQ09_00500 [Cyclobacteriaceae bacterium]